PTLFGAVVFVGENAPRQRVEASRQLVNRADWLLVLGSSLAVWSGLRFVKQARARDIPVVIVNRGATRGDELADVKIDAGVTETLRLWLGARESDGLSTQLHRNVAGRGRCQRRCGVPL